MKTSQYFLFHYFQVILKRMREKACRALEAARSIHPMDLPRAADGVALGMGIIKKEEIDDDFAAFAGRTKVFRPGATSSTASQPPLPMMMSNSSSSGSGMSPDENYVGHAHVGEWLARQEQYVGSEPHYVPPIEPPPHPPFSAPHQQHQQHQQHHRHHQHPHQHQHQHQHYHQQQYTTYAPEQPQYALEATHSIPQYMATSYPYSQHPLPPSQLSHSSLSSSSNTTTALHGSHAPPPSHHHHPQHQQQHHPEDPALSYAAAALAPQTELSQLGLAANGSRVNETWMSFVHQHSGLLPGNSPGGQRL